VEYSPISSRLLKRVHNVCMSLTNSPIPSTQRRSSNVRGSFNSVKLIENFFPFTRPLPIGKYLRGSLTARDDPLGERTARGRKESI